MYTLTELIEQLDRAEFEKHFRSESPDPSFAKEPAAGGRVNYVDRDVQFWWEGWQARSAKASKCRGVTRDGCAYLAPCGGLCTKCGKVH